MRKINKGIKLPSQKKEIDICGIIDHWPTCIKEDINWLSFMNIMEYTEDKVENETTLLPSLLSIFSMLQIRCWYSKGHDDQNKVEHFDIRCSNCGKETFLSMDNMNTKYKDIITTFLLNAVLQHVGMSQIIGTNKKLEYDMDKHNSDWVTGGPWYNTYICKNYMENV